MWVVEKHGSVVRVGVGSRLHAFFWHVTALHLTADSMRSLSFPGELRGTLGLIVGLLDAGIRKREREGSASVAPGENASRESAAPPAVRMDAGDQKDKRPRLGRAGVVEEGCSCMNMKAGLLEGV